MLCGVKIMGGDEGDDDDDMMRMMILATVYLEFTV